MQGLMYSIAGVIHTKLEHENLLIPAADRCTGEDLERENYAKFGEYNTED